MINLLCLITNYDEDILENIKKIFADNKLVFSLVSYARGTASESILDYFELVDSKKMVYVTILNNNIQTKILNKIKKELSLQKHGSGICFTLPISSSNKYVSDLLEKKGSINKMENNDNYHLIITTVLDGYAESVMSAAKKGGASGGTVINGRSLGTNSDNFLKMKIEPEKDIILIVAPEYKKNNIMYQITEKTGIKTEAKGVCIALPIDKIVGINN